jgi:hypothetical protein
MINAEDIWLNFVLDAQAYEQNIEVYLSPNGGGKYKIFSTLNNVIHIARLNVPGSSETIGIAKFKTAIDRINEFGNVIPKGKIYEHVAEEVTLVELLPFLDWDENGRNILTRGLLAEDFEQVDIGEAVNDNPENRVQVSVRQRKGQKKFRDKLLSVYDETCVISGCLVKEVLHACHINPHSAAGINISSNGVILRADIHDLFDLNLIAIEPESLTIKISESLAGTEYFQYHNKTLKNRNDGKKPSREALQERWDIFITN